MSSSTAVTVMMVKRGDDKPVVLVLPDNEDVGVFVCGMALVCSLHRGENRGKTVQSFRLVYVSSAWQIMFLRAKTYGFSASIHRKRSPSGILIVLDCKLVVPISLRLFAGSHG